MRPFLRLQWWFIMLWVHLTILAIGRVWWIVLVHWAVAVCRDAFHATGLPVLRGYLASSRRVAERWKLTDARGWIATLWRLAIIIR